MARRHGWQLPAHTLQVVAITVFLFLSIAFYAFFAPFLGKDIYEYVAMGVYSFLAFSVFILYVRSTAIDPADPGILLVNDVTSAYKSHNTPDFPEDCRRDEDFIQQQSGEEDALFCTLCNAEAFCTALSFLATVPLGELFFFHIILIRKGITTYEYVVAMRTQSEPPGPSVDGGEQQSLPSSPTGSAVTAISGRSSLGLGLQYKGAWCTPPRIFVDHQDEIIPHLGPGRVPSTVDPDVVGSSDKGKRLPQRQVRISAWKLAKLDSTDAVKAAAKARASSSVLRPVNSRHHPYDADNLSSANLSGRSSPASTDHGNNHRDARTGMPRTSSRKSSYPPSRASREDTETCNHSLSNFSSPRHTNNLTPSPLEQRASNRDHFNPIYQSSAGQSPWSVKANDGTGVTLHENMSRNPARKSDVAMSEGSRSSVFWDHEAGRFMSTASRTAGSSSQLAGTELLYTGQSIFFGGPLVNEQSVRSARDGGSLGSTGLERGFTSSLYQQGRSGRGGQLPVFVPSDSHVNQFPSRMP
ncbi:hypothetical protein IFM89_002430 [Coptis chinensis]|uniref:Palmitoyltransferase n=1 Tax=Coptis chinensis TaxID=261450 RepID=A0A835IIY3_9MAGN|nr:hypothetical protein IFM89_002430 [Coptis chinensis]